MNYIFMDLEWNQSRNRYRAVQNDIVLNGEIVQFGAIKTDEQLQELDRCSLFIKPQVYKSMNKVVSDLTEITDAMLENARLFPEVLNQFLEWCGDDSCFLTWSDSDIIMLEDNMLYYGMEIENLPRCFDVQLMFDDQIMQEGRDYALNYAMWKLDIQPERCHDALNDSVNTLEVARRLDFSEGLEEWEV